MGSVQRIKEVAGLVSGAGKNIVVLSAMSGTTNALVEIAGYYNNRNPEGAREMISRLESQYMSRIAGLYETAEAAERPPNTSGACFLRSLPSGGISSPRLWKR